MKLVVCIVHNRDKGRITDELVEAGFKFTVIGSTGGFLREGNTTFLIGVNEDELDALYGLISQNCKAREQLVNVIPFEAAPPGAFHPFASQSAGRRRGRFCARCRTVPAFLS